MKHPPLAPLTSSAISGYHYDPATKVLHLKFGSGDVWRYSGVSAEMAHKLATAESVGKFFHAHIRGKHAESKVT